MSKIGIFLVCCLFIMYFFSIGAAIQQFSEDQRGMNTQEYYLYHNIQTSDLIVRGSLYDFNSSNEHGNIETSGHLVIQEILKQENISNISCGMTVDMYVPGGTVGNITACSEEFGCPIPGPGPYEGIFYLSNWDLSGKKRYFQKTVISLPIDIIKQAIYNVERGEPVKLPDLSLAAQYANNRKNKDSNRTLIS